MKRVIVIVLAVLVALTGGVLSYGAVRGTPEEYVRISNGLLSAPPSDASAGAAHWYDLSTVLSSASTSAEKAADLMVYTAYNHVNAKESYFAEHLDFNFRNKYYACSDHYRTQQGTNAFSEELTYNAPFNTAMRENEYYGQSVEFKSVGVSYDRTAKTYTVTWEPPVVAEKESVLPEENPYIIYSLYHLPIDLGGEDNAYNEIDFSLLEDVFIINPTSAAPYYTLTFSADIQKANDSSEIIRRLYDSTGKIMKNIDVLDLSFTAEIWPSGLFRSITVHARVWASISGKGAGEAIINRTCEFSYHAIDCSVAKKIKDAGLDKYLNDANKTKCEEEYALLPTEEEE